MICKIYIKSTLLRIIIILFLLPSIFRPVMGQEEKIDDREFKHLLSDADGYYMYDEAYKKAAVIYEKLYKITPENHNLNYKLGVCYLNMYGRKRNALSLLKYASDNYVDDIEYHRESNASPTDAIYYLAYACQVNMKLDDAITNYRLYKSLIGSADPSLIEYINLQISSCERAREIVSAAGAIEPEHFIPWLSDYVDIVNPVISSNDSVFIFTVEHNEGNKIFQSQFRKGEWIRPVDITDDLGKQRDMYSNSITGDGNTLIISRDDGIRGDIYLSAYTNNHWSKINKFGKEINSKYWESHASISDDGSVLCFPSNRPKGYGGLDIYISERRSNGAFSEAKNAGPAINSRFDENTPFYDNKSKRIYYSSTGHKGYGGYDVFYSSFARAWSKPVHLPYPVNTTSDDLHYIPVDQSTGLLNIPVTESSEGRTVVVASLDEIPHQSTISVEGIIFLDDGLETDPSLLNISLLKIAEDSVLSLLKPFSNGSYKTDLSAGDYRIEVKYPGYVTDILPVNISDSFVGEKINLSSILIPDLVFSGEFLRIKSVLFNYNSFHLTDKAISELEKIILVLLDNNEFNIKINGYTDSKGTEKYNLILSERRARVVYDYLLSNGVNPENMTSYGYGESDFVAENINRDGSDNPVGRKYNRRVSLGIICNDINITIESHTSIPPHLKNHIKPAYFVVINESERQLIPGYFTRYGRAEFVLIKEFKSGKGYIYLMGEFFTKNDALYYMADIKKYGVTDSYVISEYEIPGQEGGPDIKMKPLSYTIQIHALRKVVTSGFPGLNDVRMIKGSDGLYRYITGEFYDYTRAKEALKKIHALGYKRAFIKEFSLIE